MDVTTITMPADLAREKYDEYRAALEGREPTDEDRGVLLGYKALAKGKAILDLHAVFRACPPDAKGRPALAVARAHWRHCFLRRWSDGRVTFRDRITTRGRRPWHSLLDLPPGTLPPALRSSAWEEPLRAVVPLIPPNLRPARALEQYCVLFEAVWEPVPPSDPLLIRHLHGNLYVILAAWDLSELERAVLAGRIGERPA